MRASTVIHGDAGAPTEDRIKPGLQGVAAAAKAGLEILKLNGSSLEAVLAAEEAAAEQSIWSLFFSKSLKRTVP